jgi:uncharacterized protein (DUF2147 family)
MPQFRDMPMKRICFGIAALALLAGPALAADPTGDWMVEEGLAHIRVENCSGQFWGVVTWEKDPGGIDTNNPDPAKRARPTLGMPVLLAMKPVPANPNRWDGQIYNSENGKTYTGNISLASQDVLRVEGCVLGFLCGGQNWTRVRPESRVSTTGAAPRASGTAATGTAARPRAGASQTNQEVCANVTRRMSAAGSILLALN